MESNRELVITIHGLEKSRVSMWPLAVYLRRLGFEVINFGYRSNRQGLAASVADLKLQVEKVCRDNPGRRLHFVGHSMGSIMARNLLLLHCPDLIANGSTLVMLGPPNNGAMIVRFLERYRIARLRWGPALSDLGHAGAAPAHPVNLRTMIITGGTGGRFGILPLFGQDNDGIVTVKEAKWDGVESFHRIYCHHGLLPISPRVFKLVRGFLCNGRLERNSVSSVGSGAKVEDVKHNK